MQDYEAEVKEITISDSMEFYQGGEKKSYFTSMKFHIKPAKHHLSQDIVLSDKQIKYETLRLSLLVSESLYFQAFMKGTTSAERYNDSVSLLRSNFNNIVKSKFTEESGILNSTKTETENE